MTTRPLSGGLFQFPVSRFEIDFNGQPIALFCVHAASPRDTLLYYRRGRLPLRTPEPAGYRVEQERKTNQQYWDLRIASARELLEVIDRETIPVLIVGDFNSPADGYIHGLFTRDYQDAHLVAGRGLGYTFPGSTRNPLSWGGPWMRIDFIFGGPAWRILHSVTETRRTSQHRATAATLQLR